MDGIDASCYTTYNDGTGEGLKLYAGSANNGYVNIQNQGTEDFGEAIEASWQGKYFDMGLPEAEKKGRKIYVQDSPDMDEAISLSMSVDYGNYEELEYHRKEGLSREFLFDLDNNRWRYVSPKVVHNSTGPCEVRGITIPYRVKPGLAVRRDD